MPLSCAMKLIDQGLEGADALVDFLCTEFIWRAVIELNLLWKHAHNDANKSNRVLFTDALNSRSPILFIAVVEAGSSPKLFRPPPVLPFSL
jgi:hypothetical protein